MHDFDLRIDGLNGKNYRLKVPQLQNEISVCQSMYKVKSSGITITLTKVKKGEKWTDIGAKKNLLCADGAVERDSWDKLHKATKDVANAGGDLTGSKEDYTKLIQDVYDKGDDETKKTIMKSWLEAQKKAMEDDKIKKKIDKATNGKGDGGLRPI